jgi:HD-like signal output (HDOD) protein
MNQVECTRELADMLSGAQLPALPQSAIRLLELSQDAENGPLEFTVPIESDPGLTGQVLKFVNSSYFGFSREISSVKLAINLVGIRTIKNFALWSAVFSLMPNPRCGPFDLKNLWQDSLRRGLFAREMGKLLGAEDFEDLFAAALLQDMAIPLLVKELPEQYCWLLDNRDGGNQRLSNLEQEAFGWTHAEAAGVIARGWKLPDEFASLIEAHADIENMLKNGCGSVGERAVALSALLPGSTDTEWVEGPIFSWALEEMAGSGLDLFEILQQVDEDYEEFAPALKLTTPSKSLVDYLDELEEDEDDEDEDE